MNSIICSLRQRELGVSVFNLILKAETGDYIGIQLHESDRVANVGFGIYRKNYELA